MRNRGVECEFIYDVGVQEGAKLASEYIIEKLKD